MILNENLFEDEVLDEYLQYDNRRDEEEVDETEEEFYDDSILLAKMKEKEEKEVEEQLKKEKDPKKIAELNAERAEVEKEMDDCDANDVHGYTDAVQKLDKIDEDISIPAVSDEEIAKTEESPSEKVEDNAYSNEIIDAVNDEWATVQKYQDIVNQLSEHEEFKKYIPVIDGIIKDEKNHIGNLQKVLDEINPTTIPDIKDGEKEATEKMADGFNERDKELFDTEKDEENK